MAPFLAGASVSLVLGLLVIAAFAFGADSRSAHPAVATAEGDERVVPRARGMVRNRDTAPDLAASITISASSLSSLVDGAAPLPESVMWMSAPAPTPEPVPEPTPAPTPRPTSRPTVAPVRTAPPAPVVTTGTTAAEQRMLALMNASRVEGGLAPLALDATVSPAARLHSEVESAVGYVYHDGPDGTAKSRNVPACGTGWYGENTGKIWQGNVDRLHIEFMNEPWVPINHRTNIMDPNFKRVGIGAVQGVDALYMTMVFCR